MTPKDKANQLINQYLMTTPIAYPIEDCKKFALIVANEVIDTLYEYHYDSQSGAYDFWRDVRKEIDAI